MNRIYVVGKKLLAFCFLSIYSCMSVAAEPQGIDDYFSTPVDATLVISVQDLLSNDLDADGDPLRIIFIDDWTHGAAHFDPSSGQITYIPVEGFVGEAQFTYSISDGNENGYEGLGFAQVLIEVYEYTEPVSENSPPSVVNDEFSMVTGETLTITSTQLLSNDFDLDGDTLRLLFIDDWEHGNAHLDQVSGNITFAPDDGFIGEAKFTYIVSDGHEDGYDGLGYGFVRIDVVEETTANTPPVANPDQFTGTENTALVINESDLLSNDLESDPQDSLSLSTVAMGEHGTVLFDYTQKQVIFTPETDFTGTVQLHRGRSIRCNRGSHCLSRDQSRSASRGHASSR